MEPDKFRFTFPTTHMYRNCFYVDYIEYYLDYCHAFISVYVRVWLCEPVCVPWKIIYFIPFPLCIIISRLSFGWRARYTRRLINEFHCTRNVNSLYQLSLFLRLSLPLQSGDSSASFTPIYIGKVHKTVIGIVRKNMDL